MHWLIEKGSKSLTSAHNYPLKFGSQFYLSKKMKNEKTKQQTHYQKGVRDYCGIKLPDGLKQNEKLAENLITPTTKSDEHDELISPQEIVRRKMMTQEEWDFCSKKALELFNFGQEVALQILTNGKMVLVLKPIAQKW